jgi:hypothetical protein
LCKKYFGTSVENIKNTFTFDLLIISKRKKNTMKRLRNFSFLVLTTSAAMNLTRRIYAIANYKIENAVNTYHEAQILTINQQQNA